MSRKQSSFRQPAENMLNLTSGHKLTLIISFYATSTKMHGRQSPRRKTTRTTMRRSAKWDSRNMFVARTMRLGVSLLLASAWLWLARIKYKIRINKIHYPNISKYIQIQWNVALSPLPKWLHFNSFQKYSWDLYLSLRHTKTIKSSNQICQNGKCMKMWNLNNLMRQKATWNITAQ